MRGEHLGELEELILLTVGSLYPEAYAPAIKKELTEKMDRKVVMSSIHTVLSRLENKQFVKSKFGESTPERGGKRKRLFEITPQGFQALEALKSKRDALWTNMLQIMPNPS
ncbi:MULTISPECIES: PadR family transcriptional regulator [unclassified Ekhidna]|jgi:PadR family transcriptional regulator PadR|uniref:PadR family transcriptional regulator n=1 Tax=unclassified Ekhidna TaxID=2632188 RepID=UPI0032DFECE0